MFLLCKQLDAWDVRRALNVLQSDGEKMRHLFECDKYVLNLEVSSLPFKKGKGAGNSHDSPSEKCTTATVYLFTVPDYGIVFQEF